MKNLLALAIIILGFSAVSFAQVSATATATTTIITPIAITKSVDMNFGNVASSVTAGTVVLPAAITPTRTITGGVTLPATAGTVAAAKFTVTGLAGYTYSIALSPATVTLTSGSNTMSAGTFTSTPSTAGVLNSGTQDILVGATLNVGSSQAAGLYTSTAFTVTVNYN